MNQFITQNSLKQLLLKSKQQQIMTAAAVTGAQQFKNRKKGCHCNNLMA